MINYLISYSKPKVLLADRGVFCWPRPCGFDGWPWSFLLALNPLGLMADRGILCLPQSCAFDGWPWNPLLASTLWVWWLTMEFSVGLSPLNLFVYHRILYSLFTEYTIYFRMPPFSLFLPVMGWQRTQPFYLRPWTFFHQRLPCWGTNVAIPLPASSTTQHPSQHPSTTRSSTMETMVLYYFQLPSMSLVSLFFVKQQFSWLYQTTKSRDEVKILLITENLQGIFLQTHI